MDAVSGCTAQPTRACRSTRANQTLKEAEANFRAARAQIGFARSNEAPTIGVGPSIGTVRDSANQPYFNHALANNGGGNFTLPVDLNYEIDLWGRIRRQVTCGSRTGPSQRRRPGKRPA